MTDPADDVAGGESGGGWRSSEDPRLLSLSGDPAGGLWAVTPDLSVVSWDSEGGGWLGGLGKMRLVSVGGESVWAVNRAVCSTLTGRDLHSVICASNLMP